MCASHRRHDEKQLTAWEPPREIFCHPVPIVDSSATPALNTAPPLINATQWCVAKKERKKAEKQDCQHSLMFLGPLS